MQVRGASGLMATLEAQILLYGGTMVVMGSQQLTSSQEQHVIGSVYLSLVKRLRIPTLLVTLNSKNVEVTSAGGWRQDLDPSCTWVGVHEPLASLLLHKSVNSAAPKGVS